jgi:serine/threonine-protein kinase
MLSEYGAVKIMDFGIARVVGTEHLTSDGLMMGTPAYMAPEQVLATDVDARADLYSVGVVLYRLLSGNLPFKADTAIAMAHKQLKDPPTPLRQFRAELPAWCEDVLWRALAKSPVDRFQTAEEFRDALLGHGASLVPAAVPPASLETTLPPDYTPALIDQPNAGSPVPEAIKGGSNGSPPRPQPSPSEAAFAATIPVATPAAPAQSPVLAAPYPESIEGGAPAATPGQATEPTTVILQKQHLAVAAGLFAIVVAAIGGLALLVLRQPAAAPASSATPAQPSPSLDGGQSAPSPQAATVPPAVPTQPAGTGDLATAVSAPPSGAPAPAVSRGDAAAPARRATERSPVAVPDPRSPARSAARDAALPPLTIVDVRLVAAEGTRVKEREAIMTFSSGVLTVAERNGAVVRSIPYDHIMSVNYSRSRQPMWQSPGGPAPVMRVGGGAFGMFRSDPHWVSIRMKDAFVVLRVTAEHVRSLPGAFSQRTGVTMDIVRGPAR